MASPFLQSNNTPPVFMAAAAPARPFSVGNERKYTLESEAAYNPWLRGLGVGVAGAALIGSHRLALANLPGYAPALHRWAKTFEEKSPFHMGRTFAFSERMAAYLPEKLSFSHSDLFNPDGGLNVIGQTFDRQFAASGLHLSDEITDERPLVFGDRKPGSAYLQLLDRDIKAETLFVPSEGRLAGVASRLDQKLTDIPVRRSHADNLATRAWENFQNVRASQRVSNISPFAEEAGAGRQTFRPFHTKIHLEEGNLVQVARNAVSRGRVEALEAMERTQRLMAEGGFGLKSWNSAGNVVNQMLFKRLLPATAAITGLGWLDYHLGHPSDKVIDLGLKANVLRADLTDALPGGRSVTDFYDDIVPGQQYGPLAIPATFAFAGGLAHYGKVLGKKFANEDARLASSRLLPDMAALRSWAQGEKKLASVEGLGQIWKGLGMPGKGLALGLAVMLPFVPGMLGSRKDGRELRDIYSGVQPVPVRSGRWWEVGSTPFEGGRIKSWRPHWSVLHKSRAEDISLFGSEDEKWKHNEFLHPIRFLRDPYWMEKEHYRDRPYPVASPAFSNVPLIGPLLASTIGKLIKPPVRMHEEEWDGTQYSLYSTRLEPKGQSAIGPPLPEDEFGLINSLKKETNIFAEYTGLYGFIAKSAYQSVFPGSKKGDHVFYQGSRQMENISRRYYEKELGAGIGPNPSMKEVFGYTEPLRRFVQRESFTPQANAIQNNAASWLPGDDYYINFHNGDPFTKVDEGYARLPGAGYASLHPELKDVDPDDYPDINKLAILADVAPYSREYNTFRQIVGAQAESNTELKIEYDQILNRVKQTKESVIRMEDRRFTGPVQEIEGTVTAASPGGISLEEYPGRVFQFSSVGTSAADMSARILGEHNDMTRTEVAREIDSRRTRLKGFFEDAFSKSKKVRLTIPKGSAESAEHIRAVIQMGSRNLNQELIDEGFGQYREDLGGAEAQAMHGFLGRVLGTVGEGLAFQGDSSIFNPVRYSPAPGHTKLWQERTPLEQYINNEVSGTRMRRWQKPIHDFLLPYLRGAVKRTTGQIVVPKNVENLRDLNSLTDSLNYLRGLNAKASGTYTNKGSRTSIGANQFAAPIYLASTLPDREAHYFREFLAETDPDKRARILEVASPEMQRTLSAQWADSAARIARAEGQNVGEIGEGGRLYTEQGLEDYAKASTRLDYGDFLRSQEISKLFSRIGFALPEQGSQVYDEALDYDDVKLKIVQQEGYDEHDFHLFDDRASLLWRKPYIDGAVRELTGGDDRSPDQLRRAVEKLMLAARENNADVRTSIHASHNNHTNVRLDVDVDQTDELLLDIRRNPERYDEE